MPLRIQKNISTRACYLIFAVLAAITLLSFQFKVYNFFSITKNKEQLQGGGEYVEEIRIDNKAETVIEKRGNLKSSVCQLFKNPQNIIYTGTIDKTINITGSTEPYSGPIVQGWGPEVSRDVRLYVKPRENSVLLAPFNLNNDPEWCTSTKLFIFQHSRPSNFAIRLDNRRTWMNFFKEFPYIKAIFVVGHPSGPKADEIQKKIEEEHKRYGDILQVDYIEHSSNNTLKTIFALKYIFTLNWGGHHPDYVMKSDDDIYLNVPLLVKMIFDNKNYTVNSLEESLEKRWPPMFGFLFITSPVMVVPPEKANEKYTDYLICPPYFYDKTNYPTFTSGTGYLMPWWSVPCFYQESMNLPYFFIEDVYMGGFVADRCLVPKKKT